MAQFVVLLVIYLDYLFLRKQDPGLHRRVFSPARIWLGLAWGLLLGLALWPQFLPVLGTTGLSLYFILRFLFKRALPPERKDPERLGEDLAFALDAFPLVLIWFVIMAAVSLARYVSLPSAGDGNDLGEAVIMIALASFLFVSLIYFSVERHPAKRFRDVAGLRREGLPLGKLVFLPAAAGTAIAFVAAWLMIYRPSQPTTPFSELLSTTTSSHVLLGFLVMALVLAPFFEEIIFRGYFYYVVERTRGRRPAVILVALSFAALHVDQYWGDPLAIAMVALLGLFLTMLRAWTRSCIPGIVTHYAFNIAITVVPTIILLATNPAYYEYQMHYGRLDFAAKESLLRQSLNEHPEFSPAYNDLAWLYAEEGARLAEALDLIEAALKTSPDNFAYLDTKAEVLYKMGRRDEAVRIAGKLVEDHPANAYLKGQLEKFRTVPAQEAAPPGKFYKRR